MAVAVLPEFDEGGADFVARAWWHARVSVDANARLYTNSGNWRSRATALVQRSVGRRCWVVLMGTWLRPWRRRMRLTVCKACLGELLCSLRWASHTAPGGRSRQVVMASAAAALDRWP